MKDSDLKAIEKASTELAISLPKIMGVVEVEAIGTFMLGGGKIRILLERHWVFKLYAKKHGKTKAIALALRYPNIINPIAGGYGKYAAQYDRLAKAIKVVGAEIAHMSTSFGAFQIMGFNHVHAGYPSAVEMAADFHLSSLNQILGFVKFLKHYKHGRAAIALRDGDYREFARLYNGETYYLKHYDVRLASAVSSSTYG